MMIASQSPRTSEARTLTPPAEPPLRADAAPSTRPSPVSPAALSSGAAELLAALAAFRIDDAEAPHYSFAARLCHEHRWSLGFSERAIVEYKRFLALTSLAGHPVCPSEQVDQVWHQHLVYTRSYWDRLCRDVLRRPLHHAPTAGGPAEHQKHVAMYEQTLASYRRLFGEPPVELWPPSAQRFGKDVHAARINTVDHFILDKAALRRAVLVALPILAAALLSWLTA